MELKIMEKVTPAGTYEWHNVDGFIGLQVTKDGKFREVTSIGIEHVEPYVEKQQGYYRVKGRDVHRILAEMFVPNPENLPLVHHKNHDNKDNRLENLEWGDYRRNNTSWTKTVEKWTKEGVKLETYDSAVEAFEANKHLSTLHYSAIIQNCRGKSLSAGGYVWKYGGSKR